MTDAVSTPPAGPPGATTWADPEPLDPSWGPPFPPPAERPHRSRTGLIWGAVALALVLVVVLVTALGGFKQRTNLFTPLDAGASVQVGPYELSFDRATIQHLTQSNTWEVRAEGRGRTTGTSTMAIPTGSNSFVLAQDVASREVQSVKSVDYASTENITLRPHGFNPGLAPIPITAVFTFEHQPKGKLRLALFEQEFTDRSPFGDQDPVWNVGRRAYDIALPLTELPEDEF